MSSVPLLKNARETYKVFSYGFLEAKRYHDLMQKMTGQKIDQMTPQDSVVSIRARYEECLQLLSQEDKENLTELIAEDKSLCGVEEQYQEQEDLKAAVFRYRVAMARVRAGLPIY